MSFMVRTKSLKTRLLAACLSGLATAVARSSLVFYESSGSQGPQYWGSALIFLGTVVIFIAVGGKLFANEAEENERDDPYGSLRG
jgi:hypothetical protein